MVPSWLNIFRPQFFHLQFWDGTLLMQDLAWGPLECQCVASSGAVFGALWFFWSAWWNTYKKSRGAKFSKNTQMINVVLLLVFQCPDAQFWYMNTACYSTDELLHQNRDLAGWLASSTLAPTCESDLCLCTIPGGLECCFSLDTLLDYPKDCSRGSCQNRNRRLFCTFCAEVDP